MKTIIVTAGGIGDQIRGLQAANFLPEPEIVCLSRKETFDVIYHAFVGVFPPIIQVDFDKEGEEMLAWIDRHFPKEPAYYVTPDELFRSRRAFDYKKFNVSPRSVMTKRLLESRWTPSKKIFCGLASNKPQNCYGATGALLNALGEAFPEHAIYAPFLTTWKNDRMEAPAFDDLPGNVIVAYDPKPLTLVNQLRSSEYGIFLDNGISHLAYQYGMPRLVLDPYMSSPVWISRWREDLDESVPLSVPFRTIVDIVKQNIEIPQTTLIPRALVSIKRNWSKELMFKW